MWSWSIYSYLIIIPISDHDVFTSKVLLSNLIWWMTAFIILGPMWTHSTYEHVFRNWTAKACEARATLYVRVSRIRPDSLRCSYEFQARIYRSHSHHIFIMLRLGLVIYGEKYINGYGLCCRITHCVVHLLSYYFTVIPFSKFQVTVKIFECCVTY